MAQQYKVVGKNITRIDALSKVTGKAKYTLDLELPGMLYGKILRSPYPHAKVVKLDVERAKAMPGVIAVVIPDDVPQVQYSSAGSMPSNLIIEDEMVLTDHPRYIGDRIAAVAARSYEEAEAAVRAIEIDYEVLPGIFNVNACSKRRCCQDT